MALTGHRQIFYSGVLLVLWVLVAFFALFWPAKRKYDGYQEAWCEFTAITHGNDGGGTGSACYVTYTVEVQKQSGVPFPNTPNVTESTICSECTSSCIKDFTRSSTVGSIKQCWYSPVTNEIAWVVGVPMSAVASVSIPCTFMLIWIAVVVGSLWPRSGADVPQYAVPVGAHVATQSYGSETPSNVDETFTSFPIGHPDTSRLFLAGTPNGKHCSICMVEPCNIAFRPCLHSTCCAMCSRRFATCPICRSPITERVILDTSDSSSCADDTTPLVNDGGVE
eukprot:TRINITY_DN3754_c0_g1_i1.p1 TRINITY_DN3754_c0_g1~~TRINITY_DN3754_c0_g1_i1.p1  ORF type:complete len:280 (+),score=19.95 TRINITY_DN3754_c0_g1_i1:72-911(+)